MILHNLQTKNMVFHNIIMNRYHQQVRTLQSYYLLKPYRLQLFEQSTNISIRTLRRR